MNELLERLDNIAKENGINTYRITVSTAEGDETLKRLPGNPCQNCYSVAKFFCVTAIGMLFDEGKLTPATTIAEVFADELAAYGIPAEKWANITLDNVMRHEIGFGKGFLDIVHIGCKNTRRHLAVRQHIVRNVYSLCRSQL